MVDIHVTAAPDDKGVYDGRELAACLVEAAYRLVIPYVNGCPACADALFSLIANRAIEVVHDRDQVDGQLQGVMITDVSDPEAGRKAEANHLAEAAQSTLAILSVEMAHVHRKQCVGLA